MRQHTIYMRRPYTIVFNSLFYMRHGIHIYIVLTLRFWLKSSTVSTAPSITPPPGQADRVKERFAARLSSAPSPSSYRIFTPYIYKKHMCTLGKRYNSAYMCDSLSSECSGRKEMRERVYALPP